MDVYAKMEINMVSHTELLTSLTKTVLSDIHQLTIYQSEETQINT